MTRRLTCTSAVLLAGAVLMAAPFDAGAQTIPDDARPISLTEAIAEAQRNAPAIVQARGLQRNADASRRSALGAYLPTLNLTAGSARTQGVQFFQGQLVPLTGNPWNYNNGISSNIQLFDGNARLSEVQRVRASSRVADVTVVQARFDAELQVKQQYYAALAARESEAAAKAQLEQAEQQLRASSARVAAGVATKSDSLRSAIQLGNAQLAVLTAQNDLRVANAALTRVVGSATTVTASPGDTLDVMTPIPGEAEFERFIVDGPSIQLADANLEAAKASKRAQRAAYMPTLSMTYSYSFTQSTKKFNGSEIWLFSGGNPNRQNLNFNFSYQLFNGFTRETQTVQQDVSLRNAEAQARDARLAARANLTSLLRAAQNAQARTSVQLAAIAAAEEDLRVQQQRYALGVSTLLDLLTSQTTLNQARQALIQARFDGRVARAQLAALVGRPI
ncbi:MAG: TolC family protein [Gemmatimonas sp.]